LTLRPLHHGFRCGNPLILSMLTVGIIPGILPAGLTFDYDLETDGTVEHCARSLPLYERSSIWECLLFLHDDQKIMAKGLRWSSSIYLSKPPGPPSP